MNIDLHTCSDREVLVAYERALRARDKDRASAALTIARDRGCPWSDLAKIWQRLSAEEQQ